MPLGIGIGLSPLVRNGTQLNYLPVITLPASTPVSDTEILISGTIDNGKLSTIWSIEYGTTLELGSTAPGGTITEPTAITKALTGLAAFTRYYWRIKAVNSKGTTYTERLYGATSTELGFISNQAGTNVNLVLTNLNVAAGKTVHVDWGDSTSEDLTGNNASVTKTYTSLGQFIVKFSGDVNSITYFRLASQSRLTGDISNWPIPTGLQQFNLYQNINITGDVSNFNVPSSCTGMFILNGCTKITGNPFKNNYPSGLLSVNLDESRLDNETYLILPANFASLTAINNNFTKLPRGNFAALTTLNFSKNNVSISEIDSFLLYLDNYFTGAVVPTANAVYTLDGLGMDMPTGGVNNINRLSIISKYVAAGRTCTLAINDFQVAYIDRASKTKVPLTTYVGGENETIHPSVINLGTQWNGYQYFMANTPMPQFYENPSIWASNDGFNWTVPTGVTNPIVPKPDGALNFNADPELWFEENVLYMLYMTSNSTTNQIKCIHTTDLINWSTPVILIDGDTDVSDPRPGSQSVVKVGSTYYMYYMLLIGGVIKLRRRNCSTIDGSYVDGIDVVLTKLAGRGYWHLGAKLIGSTIWIAVSVTSVDNVGAEGPFIILAKSSDKLNFTRDSDALPTMTVTEKWEQAAGLYRPSLAYIGSQLVMHYGYKNERGLWQTARINVFLV